MNPEIEKFASIAHPVQKTNSGSSDSYVLTAQLARPLFIKTVRFLTNGD